MKNVFRILTILLLFSIPHSTHPRALRNIAALALVGIPGFHTYKAYKKAQEKNKKQPEMHALIALQEFTANILNKSAFALQQGASYLQYKSNETRTELEKANTPQPKPKESQNSEQPAQTQTEMKIAPQINAPETQPISIPVNPDNQSTEQK